MKHCFLIPVNGGTGVMIDEEDKPKIFLPETTVREAIFEMENRGFVVVANKQTNDVVYMEKWGIKY